MINIDYTKLAASQAHFSTFGYKIIDAPWWVTCDIMAVTAPPGETGTPSYFLPHNNKCLVASGEQGFLYLAAKGLLAGGRYQSVTPCFRDEPQGGLHRKNFMKNELIDTENVTREELGQMIERAYKFFARYLPANRLSVELTPAHQSLVNFDILFDGKELGSYGIRRCAFLHWIYGTGCAEPRLSAIVNAIGHETPVG